MNRLLDALQRLFYITTCTLCFGLFRSYFRVHIFGRNNIPKSGPMILACNHVSGLDPIIAGWIAGRPTRFLARTTLLKGFGGYLMQLLGSRPIERNSADTGAIRAGLSILEQGRVLILFPEGTRSLDGRLQPLHGGVGLIAARAGAPVIPMYVSGAHELLPKGKYIPRPGRIVVLIGPPIYPENLKCVESTREWYDRVTEAIHQGLHELEDQSSAMKGA